MPAPDVGSEIRRLAVIMFTDMVGYSALTQRDEALSLELLEEHRGLTRAILPQYYGHEIKTTGDGFLLEFSSALAAAECAVEIQQAFAERNRAETPERQVRIRIGIHIGDVVQREGDVYGDGVNIAARIEPLAEPGGICLTNAVYEQIVNRCSTPSFRCPAPGSKTSKPRCKSTNWCGMAPERRRRSVRRAQTAGGPAPRRDDFPCSRHWGRCFLSLWESFSF